MAVIDLRLGQLVTFRLISDGLDYGRPYIIGAAAAPDQLFKVGFTVGKQTRAQAAFGGQAQPIASGTEVIADRTYKPNSAGCPRQTICPGRAIKLT